MALFSVCKLTRVEGIVLPTSFFQFLSSMSVTTLLFSLLNINHIWELMPTILRVADERGKHLYLQVITFSDFEIKRGILLSSSSK